MSKDLQATMMLLIKKHGEDAVKEAFAAVMEINKSQLEGCESTMEEAL